ncbi:STAS domain-containing protein [Catellatospora bangladeshensis]|uniref:STAS domain-containing protein n=1 Tax=Catellatospora bangladeshensis TaxID=310355 RepID=A0A8J3JDT8_9ACTN|nr:STAS domain-containing protein [Catellatospora bangladeshensis]GIF80804.1 hypothetical protein Cba03nite_21530 [Catellatospora bangladeshensis]
MSDDLRIRLHTRAGDLCLLVAGEVDMATAYLLGRVTTAVLRTRDAASLSMDMSAVTFIDAAGIAAVIGCRREAAEHRLPFAIVNPSRAVTSTIGLCGAEHLLRDPVTGRLPAPVGQAAPSRHRHRSRPPSGRPLPARP